MKIMQLLKSSILAVLILGMVTSAWSDDTADNWEKMVFHLDETRNARWALMLANAYLEDSPNAKIVIVAFGPGVDFLVEDAADRNGNQYEAAVMELSQKGVDFRVCATTLRAKDIAKERILDEAAIVPSGLSEIARLQLKEGYAYMKP